MVENNRSKCGQRAIVHEQAMNLQALQEIGRATRWPRPTSRGSGTQLWITRESKPESASFKNCNGKCVCMELSVGPLKATNGERRADVGVRSLHLGRNFKNFKVPVLPGSTVIKTGLVALDSTCPKHCVKTATYCQTS